MMDGMALLTRIIEVQPLAGYRLRLRYADGTRGVIDMAATVAKGGVFAALAGEGFGTVRVEQDGRALCWRDAAGAEVDFDADGLRRLLHADREAAE